MSTTTSVLPKKRSIPRPVIMFLLKGLLIFVLWKSLYLLVLKPERILDAPLTRKVGYTTTAFLNLFAVKHSYSAADAIENIQEEDGKFTAYHEVKIYQDGTEALSIGDPCNALEVMILYVGFIVCFPSTSKRKWLFAMGGLVSIFVVNILRCAALVQAAIYYKPYMDFLHHFAFTFIVYALIFLLWYRFTKRPKPHVARFQ